MGNIGNEVYLNIKTNRGVMAIPFIGLKELDFFTVGYRDREELVTSLVKILDLSISMDDVVDVYITGDMYKKRNKNSLSKIKYNEDDFELETLKKMYALYLKQDRRRVRKSEIRNVITEGMVKFKGGKFLSDKDIDKAVEVYFDKDYLNQRNAYFEIKGFARLRIEEYAKKNRIDGLEELVNNYSKSKRKELYQFEAREDDKFQYFIELASRSQEDFERAMDELSKSNLEEISRALKGEYSGVVDGIRDESLELPQDEDEYILELCTGKRIEELQDLTFEFRISSLFGRGR